MSGLYGPTPAADRIAGHLYSVRDFGATGDGATDDSAAFQAAHDAAAAAGGTVHVPAGSYSIPHLSGKVSMFGAGENATIIYGSGNQDTVAYNVGGGTRLFNITLADLSILAKVDQSAGAGLALDNVGYFKAHRVTVSSAGGGKLWRPLRIDSGADIRLAACRFTQGVVASRVEVTSTAKNVVEFYYDDLCEFNTGVGAGLEIILSAASPASIEGVHIGAGPSYNNGGNGVYLKNTGSGRFGSVRYYGNPNFDSNRSSGIYAETTGGGVIQDVMLYDVWCSYNNNPGLTSPGPTTGPGIYFGAGCDNIEIHGGRVQLSGGHGIQFDGVTNGLIHDVQLLNNGQGAGAGGISTYYGIAITGASAHIDLANNKLGQDPNPNRSGDPYKQNGIRVDQTTANVTCHDNNLIELGAGVIPLLFPVNYVGAATKWHEWNNQISATNSRSIRTAGSALLGTGDMASTYGLHVVGGRTNLQKVGTPVIASVVPQGATGATGYWYWVMSADRNGNNTLVSASVTIANGNATLDTNNFNRVTVTALPGTARYYLWRATTSAFVAANNIAIINANVGETSIIFDDTGVAFLGTVSPPGRDSSADMFSDGYIAPTIQGAGMSTTAPATATSGTIAVSPTVSRVKPTGNITAVILAAPSTVPANNAPYVTVVNESAFSITFDVVGTSHVANGVSCVIAALTAKHFVYDASASTPAWYPTS